MAHGQPGRVCPPRSDVRDPSGELSERSADALARTQAKHSGGGVSCSRGIAPLEYALFQLDGAVYYCKRCKPESDPVGVGMHFEYAATMRAHLAEERALKATQSS